MSRSEITKTLMMMKYCLYVAVCAVLLMSTTSCGIPPRCKIPNCKVIIDHNHPRYGETVGGGESELRVYRGLPWYRYVFRKKYRAQDSEGKYRKIDTREAYDKN